MAKGNKAEQGAEESQPRAPAPVRPFVAGFSIAAAWGAYHIPTAGTTMGFVDFGAELVAAAIGGGGAIAVMLEFLSFNAMRVRMAMRGR